MKIEINTKEDSPEEIRKAIKLLHNLMGDNVETNFAPETPSPVANIFGDSAQIETSQQVSMPEPAAIVREEMQEQKKQDSTEDLFAELFTEEEITTMKKVDEQEEEKSVASKSKPTIELY